MKRLPLVLTILFTILVVGGFSQSHTKRVTIELEQQLLNINNIVEQQNIDQARYLTDQFVMNWDNHRRYLIYYISCDELDEITSAISRLPALISHEESEQFFAESAYVRSLLGHLRHSQTLQHSTFF